MFCMIILRGTLVYRSWVRSSVMVPVILYPSIAFRKEYIYQLSLRSGSSLSNNRKSFPLLPCALQISASSLNSKYRYRLN
jgi:hypothetical protein